MVESYGASSYQDCHRAEPPRRLFQVPLRDRCSFGRFPWLISQALSVTYMAGERRLYLERNCRLPESPAHSRRRNREGPASSKGLNSQRGFGPAVEPRRKSRPRSTSLHGSSPCKCQRLSTLRWDRLPPSRPSTKSWARAGGRRLSDRRLHRWLAGTSASAPSSHGAADLLGLNRAHICVRNPFSCQDPSARTRPPERLTEEFSEYTLFLSSRLSNCAANTTTSLWSPPQVIPGRLSHFDHEARICHFACDLNDRQRREVCAWRKGRGQPSCTFRFLSRICG